MIRTALAVVGIGGLLAWNYSAYQVLQNPAAAQVAAVEQSAAQTYAARVTAAGSSAAAPLLWAHLEKSRAGSSGSTPTYPPEVQALDGKEVVVAGVLSLIPSLREGKQIKGGFLQPPSKFQCCGVTCDPRTQLLMFVDCSEQPFTFSAERTLVQVRGRLKLETEDTSWGLFSLNNARVEVLPEKK